MAEQTEFDFKRSGRTVYGVLVEDWSRAPTPARVGIGDGWSAYVPPEEWRAEWGKRPRVCRHSTGWRAVPLPEHQFGRRFILKTPWGAWCVGSNGLTPGLAWMSARQAMRAVERHFDGKLEVRESAGGVCPCGAPVATVYLLGGGDVCDQCLSCACWEHRE